jgi:signal recognition particle subunit SRP19
MPEKGERILYPCYFNANLTRDEGRRLPLSLAVKSPTSADIERALKKCGIRSRIEPSPHPSYWFRHEGRVIALTDEKKGSLIRKAAQKMGGKT